MASHMAPAVVAELRAMPGNNKCVDCLQPKPQWASVSYGVFMCLECSGKHRGLGVHLSFVRSVQMDSWPEKHLKMMRAGGNKKLRDFFKEHGILDLPIAQKYDTPAAELYRERIMALRDGRTPPTELPKRSAPPPPAAVRSSSESSRRSHGSSSADGGRPGETAIERELRLREEARERLRAKFGDGGLSGHAVGSSPMPSMGSSSGGRAGGAGSGPDLDALGNDVAKAAERGAAVVGEVAGSAWSLLSGTVKATAALAASTTRDLSEKAAEARVGEKITGVGKSVAGAVPSDVGATAASWWGAATSGATQLWGKATEASADFIKTFEEGERSAANGSRAEYGAGASSGGGNSVVAGSRPAAPPAGPAADEDSRWIREQMEQAKRNLGQSDSGAGTAAAVSAGTPTTGAATEGSKPARTWSWGDDWGDDDQDGPTPTDSVDDDDLAADAGRVVIASDDSGPEEDDGGETNSSVPASAPTSGVGARKVKLDDDDGWDDW